MKIQWHSVTWYSKLLAVILFVVIFFLGYCLGKKSVEYEFSHKVVNLENKEKEIESTHSTHSLSGDEEQFCFHREQVATPNAPYNVEEHIVLSIDEDVVFGTKTGTQNGPDMTNGYIGEFSGIIDPNGMMEVAYTYTIEGSQGRELEIYRLEETQLVKMRWPLVEGDNILTPNREGEPTLITYSKVECS